MKGLLLVNTGSPTSCKRADVKSFVGAMLSDPKVLTVPNWFRPILVKGIILPLRQFSSTNHYSLIWDHERNMSPLIYNMEQLAVKLEEKSGMPVELAMRYEQPNMTDALQRLVDRVEDLDEIIVLPLFPQYAESSYQTAVDELVRCFHKRSYSFRLRVVEPYFNKNGYIKALAETMRPYVEKQDYDRLLFSFHSLPLSHVETAFAKGKDFDYLYQIKETIRLVMKELNLDIKKTRLVYSSAMGRKWLEPDLNVVVKELAEEGAKKVLVVMPGFAVDNLETLYDVTVKAKEIFVKNGGGELVLIPCLNSRDCWIDGIMDIIS